LSKTRDKNTFWNKNSFICGTPKVLNTSGILIDYL
jgi:hypothetical protein